MEYVTLGRTGLRVSVAGLGCGGFSRLGLGTGKSKAEAVALVRQALDMGVNLLDTAAVYGTEAVVGEAIKSVPRDSVVIATKAWIPHGEGRRAAAACRREPRPLVAPARYRLRRHLPAARRVRPRPTREARERDRARAVEGAGEGQAPPSRRHRDRLRGSPSTRCCSARSRTRCGTW